MQKLDTPYATKNITQEFMGLNLICKMKSNGSGNNISIIEADMFTPKEWEKYCGNRIVTRPSTKTNEKNEEGTPYDPFFGILHPKEKCITCGIVGIGCQGHFGIIKLCIPVYNKIFFKTTLDIINCVCWKCQELKKHKDFLAVKFRNTPKRNLLTEIKKVSMQVKICESCGADQKTFYPPKDKKLKILSYFTNDDNYVEMEESSQTIYDMLTKITNETMMLLGFCSLSKLPVEYYNSTEKIKGVVRPESTMLINYPVLPLCCRPWIEKDGVRNDDDLTDMYNNLIKVNIKLSNILSGNVDNTKKIKSVNDYIEELQLLSINIMTTKDLPMTKIGKKRMGIADRLVKKEGHIIGNVGGKRCNYTARGVIVGGGPLIPMGWIGVPQKASNITTRETVTSWNIKQMTELLEQGKITHVNRGEYRLNAKFMKKKLLIGDIIHRKIKDGDVVFFNRQPSVRTESIQGVRIKLLPENAYRLPTSTTRAYNADFDGDEMNMSVVQLDDARIELSNIASTANAIVTAQNNSALMSCVQNTLILMYYITNIFDEEPKEFFLEKKYFFDMVVNLDISLKRLENFYHRAKKYYPELWKKNKLTNQLPGKFVASIVFPEDFYWDRKTGTNSKYPDVKIRNGIIQKDSGPLCKKVIGAGNTAIQYMYNMYSPERTRLFITEASFLAYSLLPFLGFSIGIEDSLLTDTTKMQNAIKEAYDEVKSIHLSEKDPEEREKKIAEKMNSIMSIAPYLAQNSLRKKSHNSYTIMRVSGTKGNEVNTGMISAFVGQQNIDGKRPIPALTNKSRSLVHFPADKSLEIPHAKGFIENGYIKGLNMTQCFMQAVSGRRGVIDTAAKTSSSGYSQKKIGKKVEDAIVHPDGTIRNPKGLIYSYLYGNDGMDPKKLQSVGGLDFPFFIDPVIEAKRISQKYDFNDLIKFSKEEIDAITNFVNVGQPEFTSIIIERANKNIKNVLKMLLERVEISKKGVSEFVDVLVKKFERSKIEPWSTVGMTACLSIGEIVMQLTLDSHRTAGFAAGKKDITTGLPRFKELLDTARSSRTSITFRVEKGLNMHSSMVFSKSLVETKLSTLHSNVQFLALEKGIKGPLFECNDEIPLVQDQEKWVAVYKKMFSIPDGDYCKWAILLKFDPAKLYFSRITIHDICKKLNFLYQEEIFSFPSPIKDCKILIMVKRTDISGKHITEENKDYNICINFYDSIKDTMISGIKNITRVLPYKNQDREDDFIFECSGSNIKELLKMNLGKNISSVYSSDFWETIDFDGIAGAKKCLYRELLDVICANGTSSVNPRHLMILIDAMTRSGTITSANRHGIKDSSFISKVMFETPIEQLKMAALYGERDEMNSVASAVYVGSIGKFGSGILSYI